MAGWNHPMIDIIEKAIKAASWLIILCLVIVTIVPANERPVSGLEHDWEHFIAFGLAGLTFGLAYTGHLGARFLNAIVFTLTLELIQIPLATRHARVEDFVVDALGACLGIVVANAFRRLTKSHATTAL